MGLLPFLLIVTSTLLSVSWNTLAKKSRMTAAFYAVVCLTSNILWWHVFFWTPLPIREFPMRFWLLLLTHISLFASVLSATVGLMNTTLQHIASLPGASIAQLYPTRLQVALIYVVIACVYIIFRTFARQHRRITI